MSEVSQIIRLSKVAREFNIGISTIVDFLSHKGIKIASNPNTKMDEKMYELLLEEFQSEKTVKEESRAIGMQKVHKETISLEDSDVKESRRTGEHEELIIKNVETTPFERETEFIKTEIETKEPTIVGKIDLSSINEKTRPDKKGRQKPGGETARGKNKKKEEETKPSDTPTQQLPLQEKKTQEPEIIKANVTKLEGPTVVGKIELTARDTESPYAGYADMYPSKRKRRKRIRKGKIDKLSPIAPLEQKTKHAGTAAGTTVGGRKKRRSHKTELSAEEIQQQVKETLQRLRETGESKAYKYRKAKRDAVSQQMEEDIKQIEEDKKTLKVTEYVTVNELATMMEVPVTDVISACLSLGMVVSINQRLNAEALSILCEEFGYKVEFTTAEVQESIPVEEDRAEDLSMRSPIVTVMGHVDHGKTSLLDYIRKSNVIAGEAGGITQHIGAYSVVLENGKKITFLDTPGHEAFTAMRARGAQVTDVAIIVISADDSIMPQTREAISHAQAAGVPMVFAINKIDKPGANPEKIREELSKMNLLVEEWGGKYQSQEISAKKGINIHNLLEKVLLEAELLDLKANANKRALGTVIESSLDKGRGYVCTMIVQAGTLRVGDIILAGSYSGRVKAMYNERGLDVKEAGPSVPVTILGVNGAPSAGDKFNVLQDEKEARTIASKRLQLMREQGIRTKKHITLDEIGRRLAIGNFKELNVIVKGDVDGSIEAISDSLLKLSTDAIKVNVIHRSIGQITESDVLLASASDAIIIGFQVRPSVNARKLAEREQIDIRFYSVIYDAIEEVRAAMEGLLEPKMEEHIVCNLEVREVYKITKVGTVAGCYVQDGKIMRNTKVRIIRDGIVVYLGELGSLKRFKDDAKEVTTGYECGLNIKNYNDIKAGDNIEGFEEVEVKQTL